MSAAMRKLFILVAGLLVVAATLFDLGAILLRPIAPFFSFMAP